MAIEDRAQEGLKIGQRVKALREKQNFTLQDIAAKTGLAKSLLSEVESGEVMPHVSTLLKLATALNVGMASFFEDAEAVERVSVTRRGERVRIKRRPHHHEGEVDYVYESLEPKNPHKHMEPFLVEFQPMETGEMVFMSHEGEEFHFVLEGRLEFRTDDRVEVLYPGDSLYFESEMNHSFRSLDAKPARALVVVWNRPN
jgi:transcriptional regulator with XRE-family HTH domain